MERPDQALETGVSKERTIAFSDGVFAIAITLLILNVEVPDIHPETGAQLRHELADTWPDLLSYFIGFYVIGKFWLGHHQLFGSLRALDWRITNANLLYLALIALLPFPTGILGDHGSLPVAVMIFAVAVAAAGLGETLLLWLAFRSNLAGPPITDDPRARYYEALIVPVVFIASIPVALVNAEAGKYFWLLLLVAHIVVTRLKRS